MALNRTGVEQWRTLQKRLERVSSSVKSAGPNASYFGSMAMVDRECGEITNCLLSWFESHKADLPRSAEAVLNSFQTTHQSNIEKDVESDPAKVASKLLILELVVSQLEWELRDTEERLRSLTERAFLHLNCLLAVDKTIGAIWQSAYKTGEEECEKLGAVHLLQHGIWSFKASAGTAGTTDLVLMEWQSEYSQAVEGCVLSEWKKVFPQDSSKAARKTAVEKASTEARRKIVEARKQSDLYSTGVLAQLTMQSTRYVVLVSDEPIKRPDDCIEDRIRYRHVCICVEPRDPSTQARSLT